MSELIIRAFRPDDLPGLSRVWNGCVKAGETLLYPLTEGYFQRKFVDTPGCEPRNLLVAEAGGQVIGFAHGVAPLTFRGGRPGDAYLTALMVDRARRGRGVGRALLGELAAIMRRRGAIRLLISSVNPVNLDWRIPGSPGHDHNNMPGADAESPGFGFLTACGFAALYREVAMYIDLSGYRAPEGLEALRAKLHWRDALRTEIAAWKASAPNADARFWADGRKPAGPRVILTAVHEGQIVGFTGPVDRQRSGRGWFTGICTDPEYGRRGIATVLFNDLLRAFRQEGAAFTSLFTGEDNPAKKIYLGAGMRPARRFALMALPLEGGNDG